VAHDEFSTALGGAIQVDGSDSHGVFKDAINEPVIAQDSYVLVNARVRGAGLEARSPRPSSQFFS
jgi:hypothetical protein